MEAADRKLILGYVERHLQGMCGTFRIPRFSANIDIDAMNERLVQYRTRFKRWVAMDKNRIYDSLPDPMGAGDRLHDAYSAFITLEDFRCSRMRRRSGCVNDELYARAEAATKEIYDPIEYVANAEVERCNEDLAAFNRAVKRHNASVGAASFLHELARAERVKIHRDSGHASGMSAAANQGGRNRCTRRRHKPDNHASRHWSS